MSLCTSRWSDSLDPDNSHLEYHLDWPLSLRFEEGFANDSKSPDYDFYVILYCCSSCIPVLKLVPQDSNWLVCKQLRTQATTLREGRRIRSRLDTYRNLKAILVWSYFGPLSVRLTPDNLVASGSPFEVGTPLRTTLYPRLTQCCFMYK